jgi:lambda family phage portal protein
MNWLDRSISWVAPQAGLRRARARLMSRTAELAYEGAKAGRRTDGWITSGSSANVEIGKDLAKLRERSRDLIRNNHFAAKAALEFAVKIVGTGITVRSASAPVAELWAKWQRECSADGLPNFAAIQALVARTVFESGECLVRRRTRTASVAGRMAVPIQLQVLEPDYLDASRTDTFDGGYRIHGVEFNNWGQRTGYWLFPQHPGEVVQANWSRPNQTSAFVPAAEILHVADLTSMRPGQVRGVPHLAPVMLAMRDLDDWEDAEIVRKKTESCLAAIVTDPNGDQALSGGRLTDSEGRTIETFSPGMIGYGASGFDVKFNTPAYAGGYADYKRSRVRDLAVGVGMIYEVLSGDLSQVNYSSYRAGLIGFRDRIESLQWNVLIPLLCEPVWAWFIAAAIEFSGLPSGDHAAEWGPPPFDLLDREAEAKADDLMLGNGTMTWPQAVQRQGWDAEKQVEEIATWKPRLDAAGVILGGAKPAPQGGVNETANPAP